MFFVFLHWLFLYQNMVYISIFSYFKRFCISTFSRSFSFLALYFCSFIISVFDGLGIFSFSFCLFIKQRIFQFPFSLSCRGYHHGHAYPILPGTLYGCNIFSQVVGTGFHSYGSFGKVGDAGLSCISIGGGRIFHSHNSPQS